MNGRNFIHVLFIIVAMVAGATVGRVLAFEASVSIVTSLGDMNTRQGILAIIVSQIAGGVIGLILSAGWAWYFTKPQSQ